MQASFSLSAKAVGPPPKRITAEAQSLPAGRQDTEVEKKQVSSLSLHG
jgi:hypothetical protein